MATMDGFAQEIGLWIVAAFWCFCGIVGLSLLIGLPLGLVDWLRARREATRNASLPSEEASQEPPK